MVENSTLEPHLLLSQIDPGVRIDAHQQAEDGSRHQAGQQHQCQPKQTTLAQTPGSVGVVLHDGPPVGHGRQGNQLPFAVVQLTIQSIDFRTHLEARVQIDGDSVYRIERFLRPVDVVFGFVESQHVPIGANRAAVRVLDVLELLLWNRKFESC